MVSQHGFMRRYGSAGYQEFPVRQEAFDGAAGVIRERVGLQDLVLTNSQTAQYLRYAMGGRGYSGLVEPLAKMTYEGIDCYFQNDIFRYERMEQLQETFRLAGNYVSLKDVPRVWLVNIGWEEELHEDPAFPDFMEKDAEGDGSTVHSFGVQEGTRLVPGQMPDRNVILIVLDAFRADHQGMNGYTRQVTPRMDAFAGESLYFDRAYSTASWTVASMTSYLTSLYPTTHRVDQGPGAPNFQILSPRFITLAESLRGRGYLTAGITSQPWFSKKLGLTAGFDDLHTVSDAVDPLEAERLTDALIQWLEESREERFFLYAHYMGGHTPYNPPPPWKGKFTADLEVTDNIEEIHRLFREENDFLAYVEVIKMAEEGRLTPEDAAYLMAEYDEKLLYTDHHLGRLLDRLEELGLMEESIVIITADHGEAFLEHGTVMHRNTPYNELLNVPLVISAPGLLPRGERISRVVDLTGIYPTVHDLLGIDLPGPVQGESLLPAVDGKGRGYAFAQHTDYGAEHKIVTGDWSAFFDHLDAPPRELYHLTTDPGERENLAGRSPEGERVMMKIAREVMGTLREAERLAMEEEAEKTTLDEELREKLKSLGYLQ